ncbi:MAG: ABC transporter ATP-binding protein [Candidatus Promineofilum sp.]|nr:ABC transporter ATP-binding protein [Promineifilum sp.]
MDQSVPTQPVRMLGHYLRPFRGRVALLTLLLLTSIGLQLLAPQLLGRFVDAATGQGDGLANRLTLLAALFFAAVLAQKALFLITVYFTEDLGWATTNALRADLTAHVLRLDMGFHKLRTPGELIERIDGDVGELAEYFSEIVVSLIGNGLLVAGIIALIFLKDWRIGLVALGYAIIMVTLLRVIQERMVKLFTSISRAVAELFGFLEEHITGTEDVIPNGGAPYVMARLYPLLNTHARLTRRTYTLSTIVGATSTLLFVLALAGSMGLAALSFRAGAMTIGTVFTLVYYVGLLESPLDSVRRHLSYIQRALAGVNRTREFFDLRPEVAEATAGADRSTLSSDAPGVAFDAVSFAYKDRRQMANDGSGMTDEEGESTPDASGDTPTVLHEVSFAVAPGRVLGVLGRTGSGKTTLTRLLFRLYDVDAGSIRIGQNGGVDLRDVALSELRRHVGLVTQDVQLFAATVRDNLTLFSNYDPTRPANDDGRIVAALQTLGLGDWYRGLPDGLDTVLESGGKGLSAGEGQLLAFTRVFLRDPRLVVLDEASSRLDPGTEALLERAIDRLLDGRTGIIIAHRLRTVGRADDILILENGRVVEFGPRAALAADPDSRFYRLLQTGLEEVLA